MNNMTIYPSHFSVKVAPLPIGPHFYRVIEQEL
jgi:hypothetical protein